MGQVGFIKALVAPLWTEISRLCPCLDALVDNLEKNQVKLGIEH